MTKRIFPRETLTRDNIPPSGSITLNTISEVLTLDGAGTTILSVSVIDENDVYIFHAGATSGDFEDTVHGGYWDRVSSESDTRDGNELSFDIISPATQELYTLPDNIVVNTLTMKVYEPFDVGVQIEVGDNISPAAYMTLHENKPTKIGIYKTHPEYMYKNVSPDVYKLKINFLNLNTSNGKCIITIEYSKLKF